VKACVTCSKPASLGICLPCAERAESMLFAVTPWTPFEKATLHPDVAKEGFDQCWKNSRYTVLRRDVPSQQGHLVHLSIKRNDKNPMHDWREIQRIKNELLGKEEEAMELYPAESRLIDTANQYHLFCFLGMRAPFGYESERCVMEEVGSVYGGTGKQRPFEEKPVDLITDAEWQERFAKRSKDRQLAMAAEDLLEALKGCMGQIEVFDPGGCKPGLPYDRLKAARAAISKATEGK
jgi:hypothetical protein